MYLDYINDSLYGKWKELEGHPAYLSKDISFNQIFQPIDQKLYEELEKKLDVSFPQGLLTLYSECNGFRLFLSSFSFFGLQTGEGDMVPFDFYTENHNIHLRMRENGCDDTDWIFVGNYGRNYVFTIKRSAPSAFYLLENGKDKVIAIFDSLDEVIRYFIPRMIEHYDDNYVCDQPREKYKKIPALANALYDLSAVGL